MRLRRRGERALPSLLITDDASALSKNPSLSHHRPQIRFTEMHIGAAIVSLHIHGARSLKDKRRTIHSVVGKLRNRHSVSVAEVDANDSWQSAKVGIGVVSGDAQMARSMLDRAIEFVESAAPEAEVIDVSADTWSMQ